MKLTPLILSALLAVPAFGQTAYTLPSGYVKTDLVVGFNPIGINLHGQILAAGTITAESGANITDTNVNFGALLTDATATYTIEITSGTQDGAVSVITAISGSTLTIEGSGISAGLVSYQVRQAKTLNEVFGTGTDATLTGSFNANSSDIIWVPDGAGDYDRYYYNSNFNEFRSTTSQFTSPPKPISFFYPDGAYVEVKATPKTITLFGEVKTTGTIISAPEGFTIVSVPSPVGQTLDELSISDDLNPSFNTINADIVWAYNSTTNDYDRYFVHTTGVWRSTTSQFSGNEGSTVVEGALIIQRKSPSTVTALAGLPTFFMSL